MVIDQNIKNELVNSVSLISVSIFSAAGVSDLMTGELSVAVKIGKLSKKVVEIFRLYIIL